MNEYVNECLHRIAALNQQLNYSGVNISNRRPQVYPSIQIWIIVESQKKTKIECRLKKHNRPQKRGNLATLSHCVSSDANSSLRIWTKIEFPGTNKPYSLTEYNNCYLFLDQFLQNEEIEKSLILDWLSVLLHKTSDNTTLFRSWNIVNAVKRPTSLQDTGS